MAERHSGLNPSFNLNSNTDEPSAASYTLESANKIEKLIYNDTLTGFENRRGLKRYKDNLESHQYPLTIITFDLDKLKQINDNPDPQKGGHQGGDKYILSFVKFVNQVFPEDKKFRLGGDEFAIPISNLNPEILNTIYPKLEAFNKEFITDDKTQNKLKFTYASDIATSEEDFYNALKRSDDKLVEAKNIKHQSSTPSNS